MKHKLLKLKALLVVLMMAVGFGQAFAEDVTYSFTITASDFNTTSYAANNGSHSSTATCTSNPSKTMEVDWTSYQVMKNSSNMQWQKNKGYIYNTTDLGTIVSVEVTSSEGSFTKYYGTTEHPTSGTTVGDGFFTVSVGGAKGITSSIVVTFTVTEEGGGGSTTTATAVSAPDGFVTDLNGNTGVSAGTLTATVTPEGESALTNPTITWSSDNTKVATVNASTGAVTIWSVGSAKIKAKYDGDENYGSSEGIYNLTVTNSNPGNGSLAKPYTVAEALALIDGYSSESGSSTKVYTKGIVSSVGTLYNSTMLTYYISIDGTSSNTIQVYRGKNVGNTDFSATSDLKPGDVVIVYGQLYKYNSTAEINTENYLYSLNDKIKPTITFGKNSYEVAYNGTLTISATSEPTGTITYSSSDTKIAEINATTGVVTPHNEGEVTIRATLEESNNNIEWYEEVILTVTDGRTSAGIAYASATITKTWGESFTGQALTNDNELTVSYTSTVPAVATVDAGTGVVTILKAGITVIKAAFNGNDDFMPAEVSYTLTVNKANADLSFNETEFDIDLNDDSFVAPTLNNPNSLTVSWESDNTDIATVDAETGALTLITTAEGTVTITASFTTNDWYVAGNASYTITITDPNKKGTKKNPFTVSEVIDGTATGSDIYVVGYIVGEYVGKSANPKTSSFTTNASFAIAEEFTSSPTASGSIPVQLPTNPLKNAWGNQTNNGTTIGYKVIVKGNKETYFSVNGIKSTSAVEAISVRTVVSTSSYATFAANADLDFTDSNIKAYIAKAKDDGTGVTFDRVYKIPAGTGVLLYKDGGATEYIPVTTKATDDVTYNVFVRGTGENVASVVGNMYNYILNKVDNVVGFYKAAGNKVAKNRAYIQVESASLAKDFISMPGFDDSTTGVTEVNGSGLMVNGPVYDLQGRRVEKPGKGLYIVNGKKVLKY